jgi:hypothetical protein
MLPISRMRVVSSNLCALLSASVLSTRPSILYALALVLETHLKSTSSNYSMSVTGLPNAHKKRSQMVATPQLTAAPHVASLFVAPDQLEHSGPSGRSTLMQDHDFRGCPCGSRGVCACSQFSGFRRATCRRYSGLENAIVLHASDLLKFNDHD